MTILRTYMTLVENLFEDGMNPPPPPGDDNGMDAIKDLDMRASPEALKGATDFSGNPPADAGGNGGSANSLGKSDDGMTDV